MTTREKSKDDLLLYSTRLWPIILLYLFLSIAFLYRCQTLPSAVPSSDAAGYIYKGLAFRQIALLADLGTVRTYGYPLIVYLYSFVSGFEPLSVALVAGIFQLTIFGVSALWLASRLSTYSVTLATAVAIGLLLNPILVSLVADVLTEGVSIIVVVLTLTCLFNSVRASTTAGMLVWAAFGAAISNFALMIRPANLVILIGWNVGFFISLFFVQRRYVNRVLVLFGYVGVFLSSAAVAWTPQYLHNVSLSSGGILPIMPIFDIQLGLGIILLKYSSIVLTEYAEGLVFPNPWCIDPIPDTHSLVWYFEHPIRGVATIAGHLFSAFNFEYPFVYVYDLDPLYSVPVAWAMWIITAVGLLNGIRLVHRFSKTCNTEYLPMLTMTGSLFLLVTGLNAFIAVENRFNVIPVAILSVLAVEFVLSYRNQTRFLRKAVPIFALCVATFGVILSEKARNSAVRLTEPIKILRCLPDLQTVSPLLDQGR